MRCRRAFFFFSLLIFRHAADIADFSPPLDYYNDIVAASATARGSCARSSAARAGAIERVKACYVVMRRVAELRGARRACCMRSEEESETSAQAGARARRGVRWR